MKPTKLVFLNPENIDHLLFCLLYKQVYKDKYKSIIFESFTQVDNVNLLNVVDEILFVEHLPVNSVIEIYEINYKHIKFDVISSDTYLPIKFESIFSKINISQYVSKLTSLSVDLWNEIYCGNEEIQKRTHIEDNIIDLILIYDEITKIFAGTFYYSNKRKLTNFKLETIFKEYLTFDVLINNILLKGVYNRIFFEKFSNPLYFENKYKLIRRDLEFNLFDRTIFIKETDKEKYLNTLDSKYLKIITIKTSNLKQDINFVNYFLECFLNEISNYGDENYYEPDFIEIHNFNTVQSIFIPVNINKRISSINIDNGEYINYYESEDTDRKFNLLVNYFGSVPKEVIKPDIINPLLSIIETSTLKQHYNDYTNPITPYIQ